MSNSTSAKTLAVAPRACANPAVPAGAVVLNPGADIQAAVSNNPAGTIFYLNAGVYRQGTTNFPVYPASNNVFMGACGAVINGSTLLTSFTYSNGSYQATNVPLQTWGINSGSCAAGGTLCTEPQDLFVDNVPLTLVSSASALVSGTWYLDTKNGIAYMYDNPAGHTVEISTAISAFITQYAPLASNVTFIGLTIEKFAGPTQYGAIGHQYGGPGWIMLNNELRYNHSAGIVIGNQGSGSIARGNYIHDNGALGITGGGASSILVANNEMANNGYAGYDCSNGCGGVKFGEVYNATMLGNYIHDSTGYGLWCDVDCGLDGSGNSAPVIFQNNYIANNQAAGIFCEISHYCNIFDNIVLNNGANGGGWAWGAGIGIAATDHATIYNNIVSGNFNGIDAAQQSRGNSGITGQPYEVTNLYVHDNVITITAASQIAAGIYTDDGDYSLFTPADNNVFKNNIYNGLSLNSYAFIWWSNNNWYQTASSWQAVGNDTSGVFNP